MPRTSVAASCSSTVSVPGYQVIVPDFGTVEGPFQITSLEYSGTYNGEATYELSLASAGALSFTAMP